MASKILFSALVALLVAQVVLADKILCPDPSAAKEQVYNDEIHEDAPLFGRVSKQVAVAGLKSYPSCILLTGIASAASGGDVSITSIGLSEEGVLTVNLVSDIKRGIDVVLEVYV